jgi:hypothetical protein
MSDIDDIDSELEEILPESETAHGTTSGTTELEGKFQMLASLAGYLGVYNDLTNPGKDDLLAALTELGVQNSGDDLVYDFLQIHDDVRKGFIRSKRGEWIERDLRDVPTTDLSADFSEYARLASFLRLYERYGLDNPSGNKLRHALIVFGVEHAPEGLQTYLAPIEDGDGTVHVVGIETGDVTTAYPVDANGYRIGDDAYTRDLLPRLLDRLASGSEDGQAEVEEFVPPLPQDIDNLLDNEVVAENYQTMMHRLADQAAGENVSDTIRSKKLAQARFITEVLSGERTWE